MSHVILVRNATNMLKTLRKLNFAKIIEICLNVLDRENGIASSLTSMQVFKHCDSTGFIHTLKKNLQHSYFKLRNDVAQRR